MTPTEAATLARYIGAHFPQQPFDEFTADALGELLAPYPFADCRAAVLAIAERGEHWCSPSDVRAQVRRIRAKRIDEHPPVTPPEHLATFAEWQTWQRELNRRIGDGETFNPNQFYSELKPRNLGDLRELMPSPHDDTQPTTDPANVPGRSDFEETL